MSGGIFMESRRDRRARWRATPAGRNETTLMPEVRSIQAPRLRFLRRRSRFWRCGLGLQLPQHIDDFPFAVEFRDFEIIDPIGRDDFHDRGIIVTIENRHLFQLPIWRCLFPPPSPVCWTSAIASM